MKMLIDSQWVESSSGEWQDVYNSGTGELIDRTPTATREDVERAVQAAQGAFETLRRMPAHKRSEILMRISESIMANHLALGELLARENGKPIQQTRAEVIVTARIFRGFAEEAKRIFGRVIPMDAVPGNEKHFAVTIRQPFGVVAAIIPFNYPVELWAHKAAPALAAGNPVVTKPPRECPLTILKIAELMEAAGLPRAAHQVVTGAGSVVGSCLAGSPGIRMVNFTGSNEVGIQISKMAAETFKKIHMELGGNDAMIVCADADLDKAVLSVVLGRLARGNGQICCAIKRIFVDATIYDRFAEELAKKAKALKVGNQLDEDTDVGPLINEAAAIQVEELVNKAIKAGAKLIAGGHRRKAFMEPTVLRDVPTTVELFCEETFGPVVPLVKFTDEEDAIRMANESQYGLQAAVFTKDIGRAMTIAHRLEAGGVIVNWSSALRVETLPFGGVKMSGNGREGIHDTLMEMTEQKIIILHDALSIFQTD
jgi:acyl-CoA reductase-like NAD-dependent aldehyde dehydrogenase